MQKPVLITFFLFCCGLWLGAQSTTADIYGSVVLSDGSGLPGVSVTLRGEVLGTQSVITSVEGNFRFLRLQPAEYELIFELEGFKTVVRKNLRLYAGKNLTLTIVMEPSQLKEEIVVTARPAVVDVRRTTVGMNVSKEQIQSLPSARNPWSVLSLVPGMMMDRPDVGGAESGQQSAFYAQGSSRSDTSWNVDGINTTDLAEPGASTSYLDVNAYEELQISVGANDITAQTGGVQINFVSKRGGNNFSGTLHLYVEDQAWEMKQTLPASITSRGWTSPGVNRLYQYGINFGGPVIKDRLWFFGSYGIQDIHSRTIVGDEDATWLAAGYFKLNFQKQNTAAEFSFSYDNKLKWGRTRLNRAQQDQGSLRDQDGPNYYIFGTLQQIFGNLMLTAKAGYYDCNYRLIPRGSKYDPETGHNIGNDRIYYYRPTKLLYGSDTYFDTTRRQINLSLDGNYFAEKLFGANHEVRFGVDYSDADVTSMTLWPNQRTLDVNYYGDFKSSLDIRLLPDSFIDMGYKRVSFYLADTISVGRFNINIGLRYDDENNYMNETQLKPFTWHQPGSPDHGKQILSKWLGPLKVKGGKVPAKYSLLSPRFSITYDITGKGTDVLKATVARYGSQVGTNLAFALWPVREIDLYWYDNGDGIPTLNEVELEYFYLNYCVDIDYSTGWRKNKYAPDYNTPLLDELTLSYEKQISEDLAVSLSGFYKKKHNQVRTIGIFADGTLETKANWYKKGEVTFPDGSKAPFYSRYKVPEATYYTNYEKAYDRYLAVQLTFTKRLSKRWMMDASFIWQDWKAFDYEEETFDLTNFNYFNGGVVAPRSGASGLEDVYVNSRWQLKLSGLYQLPFGINLSGVLTGNEGYVIPYYVVSPKRGGGLSRINIYEPNKKFGDDRLPALWILNLGLEKEFKINDQTSVTMFVDGYNVTNRKTTLSVNNQIGPKKDEILRVLNPGIFQFGVRVKF